MQTPQPIVKRNEYRVTVEDTTLHLMIDVEGTELVNTPELSPFSAHTHAYTEVCACLEGEIVIATATDPIRLGVGDLAIVPAHLRHCCAPTQKGNYRALGVLLVKRQLRGRENLYRPLSRLCLCESVFVKRDCPELCRTVCALGETSCETDSPLPALDMLRLLLSLYQGELSDRSSTNFTPSGGEIKRIAQLEDIIETQYQKDIAPESIAQMLFISPRQLARIVKRRYGTTLHDRILHKRIRVAADLLAKSERPVEEIGSAVGFRSRSCFYQAFKTIYGVTPLAYRKRENNPITRRESPTEQGDSYVF